MTATPTIPVDAAPATAPGDLGDPGFGATFAAEWRKLRSLAEVYLLTHGVGMPAIRFDVASVALRSGVAPGGTAQVELFEDAF